MPSSTRSHKESQLIFSPDPASLERTIRKEALSLSTDNNTSDSAQPPSPQTPVPSTDSRSPLSIDNTNLPSTDTLHPKSIDIPSRTSIDTEPRYMVAPLILVRDNNGDLHDQEGHLFMKPQTSSRRIGDPGFITACHCGAEYETEYPASPGDWENGYYNPTMAVHTAIPPRDTLHAEEYDEDYKEERATEYIVETAVDELGTDEPLEGFTTEELLNHQERSDTDSLFAEACGRGIRFYRPFTRANRPSIDINLPSSIDISQKPPSTIRTQMAMQEQWMDMHCKYPERTLQTFFRWLMEQSFQAEESTSYSMIDVDDPSSIDRRPEFGKRAYDRDGTRRFHWEENDEYGVYRDDQAYARDVDGHVIRVSRDNIRRLLERASRDEHNYICLPEHASSFTQTKLVPEIYTKDEINEVFYGVCGSQEKNEEDFQMKLDGVYYPLNDSISWLTTCMEEMRQDIAKIQTKRAAEATAPTSIERRLPASVEDNSPHSNPIKSPPDSYTRADIDQLSVRSC
ncbi:hypothetical protein DY000_02039709 [Brassica cretica]|uniref:Uncharacterized protein n=1 Tax=Brassica cretica TaxID=69181 RepID=A0ABQ7BJD2_BRACR|nr:hypothetical protein DY000_02039709 [Brassica cretica]